jgi:maltooligosyltrehalose trehalohydrolase
MAYALTLRPEIAAETWTLDLGANVAPGGVGFCVWAPAHQTVEVQLENRRFWALQARQDGLFEGFIRGLRAGARYGYVLDGQGPFPDPCSRSQPEGVHGPSEVVDPRSFVWHDHVWPGLKISGLVIYQCHVGTLTPEGTFDSLIDQLPRLAALGVTAVEPLPAAEFPGTRNWGYDGVDLFAPSHVYGGPEALKRFVDAAHQHGLGVIVDVVYNHLGPDGNYLRQFSPDYFTDRYHTPWGEAINYDGPRSDWVRRFVIDNARYWISEYHADGLRLDATHAIYDRSPRHILGELAECVRSSSRKPVVLIAETSENAVRYLRPASEDGFAMDAVWADDFHHALRRYLVGDHEGYYADYTGSLEEVARCIQQGWLYEGQVSPRTGRPRGSPARDRPAWQFVYVLQNHDQVGNRAFGERLNHQVDLERYRAAAAVLLFLPFTPLLFMGQEFAASTPFQYFTDHTPDLGRLVTEGRRREFQAFSAFVDPHVRETIPDPQALSTFENSKLRLGEADRSPGREMVVLYQALLRLRREDPVLSDQARRRMSAEVLSKDVLLIRRWRGTEQRVLLANFGDTPVAAPPGQETVLLATSACDGTFVPGRCAVILAGGAA